jgi:leucyl-tRNA synthetase
LEQILKDKGFAPTEEPFKKINQGMILGTVLFYVYRLAVTSVTGHSSLGVVEMLRIFIFHIFYIKRNK